MISDNQEYKRCLHRENCVLHNIEVRDIIEGIMDRRRMEVYLCENVQYHIHTPSGVDILISDLSMLKHNRWGFYVTDPLTGIPCPLSKENFEILCTRGIKECAGKDYVRIWTPKKKEREAT